MQQNAFLFNQKIGSEWEQITKHTRPEKTAPNRRTKQSWTVDWLQIVPVDSLDLLLFHGKSQK